MFFACSDDPTSPKQQIRNSLKAMEIAAQERSTSDFMVFLRNQKINIFTVVKSIEIQGKVAQVEISAAMASRDVDLSQKINRLKADAQRFSITLIPNKNNATWLIQSANWQQGW